MLNYRRVVISSILRISTAESIVFNIYIYITDWWFGTFFHILGRIIPFDFHIFQRGRSTTNQYSIYYIIYIYYIHTWWLIPLSKWVSSPQFFEWINPTKIPCKSLGWTNPQKRAVGSSPPSTLSPTLGEPSEFASIILMRNPDPIFLSPQHSKPQKT